MRYNLLDINVLLVICTLICSPAQRLGVVQNLILTARMW